VIISLVLTNIVRDNRSQSRHEGTVERRCSDNRLQRTRRTDSMTRSLAVAKRRATAAWVSFGQI